jgi:hypothetical protein
VRIEFQAQLEVRHGGGEVGAEGFT